jgi:hypothetical protein
MKSSGSGRPRRGRLACLIAGAALLAACQTAPQGEPRRAPLGIAARAVSDQDFELTPPWLGLARGVIFIRGGVCPRKAADTPAPARVAVTGYDVAGRPLFRREIGVEPTVARNGDACHRYASSLAGVLTPKEIEVRAVRGGGPGDGTARASGR